MNEPIYESRHGMAIMQTCGKIWQHQHEKVVNFFPLIGPSSRHFSAMDLNRGF